MARDFNGSTQYLSNASAVLTAAPLTMACWFYPTNDAAVQRLMSLGISGSANHIFGINLRGDVGGDPIHAVTSTTSAATAISSTGYSINTWQHACAVFASATDRKIYLNGGSEGTNATNRTPVGVNSSYLGAAQAAAVGSFFVGRIAEAGIWNVALSTSEVAALAKGVSPLRIRPNALVAYWPLFGVGSPEPDYSNGGFAMTLNNSPTQIDHAPVMPAFYLVDWFGSFGPPPAGASLSINVSETITLTESATAATSAPQVSTSETVTLTESATAVVTISVSASETITLTENAALNLVSLVSASETVTLTENTTAVTSDPQVSASETVTLTEATTTLLVSYVSASDTITLTDNAALVMADLQVSAAETVTVSETAGLTLVALISASETVSLTETVTTTTGDPQVSVSETVTLSEMVSVTIVVANVFSVAVNEDIVLQETATAMLLAGVSVGETITLTELVTLAVITTATLPDNAAYVTFRDKRAMARFRDKRVVVKGR